MRYVAFMVTIFLFMTSCEKEETKVQKQLDKDIQLIEDYLKDKNLTAEKTSHGIYYIIDEPGSEEKPKVTSTVVVNYKGYFTDEVEFDAGEKATFPLYNVIQGWQIGIPKFGKGGKGKLLIPSKYAYEDRQIQGRSNAVLIFDIELLDIL
ncbi:MAG: FKBP-type peptidyl-prolyl cis-trans isomerase [Chitinophagales bacterium]|nr:FKBP-type peptidyl-prolyl cis-trans isomerase [Chitinophagales bacterium]